MQEIRLGGVMQRLQSCRERLKSYLAGETEKIEELEEPAANYFEEVKDEDRQYLINYYSGTVTVNIL